MVNVMLLDSGVGGLSILDHLIERVPSASYSYVLDNGFWPYGDKLEEELISRSIWLIEEAFLHIKPDILVIACNTLSTLVLPTLRARLAIDIVGVVPAIKPASKISQKKVIGLLATPGTIRREYTKELIKDFAADCRVLLHGSTRLVALAEDKLGGRQISSALIRGELEAFFKGNSVPDTIVLGCTHFPLLKDELDSLFPKINFIDSGIAVAARVESLMGSHTPRKKTEGLAFLTEQPKCEFLTRCLKLRQLENLVILG